MYDCTYSFISLTSIDTQTSSVCHYFSQPSQIRDNWKWCSWCARPDEAVQGDRAFGPWASELIFYGKFLFEIWIVVCGYWILTPFFTCCHCSCCWSRTRRLSDPSAPRGCYIFEQTHRKVATRRWMPGCGGRLRDGRLLVGDSASGGVDDNSSGGGDAVGDGNEGGEEW